jgi:hypothetical protein
MRCDPRPWRSGNHHFVDLRRNPAAYRPWSVQPVAIEAANVTNSPKPSVLRIVLGEAAHRTSRCFVVHGTREGVAAGRPTFDRPRCSQAWPAGPTCDHRSGRSVDVPAPSSMLRHRRHIAAQVFTGWAWRDNVATREAEPTTVRGRERTGTGRAILERGERVTSVAQPSGSERPPRPP